MCRGDGECGGWGRATINSLKLEKPVKKFD